MLILVVWTIVLLSVLAVGLGSRCAFALGLTERMEQTLRASYIAAAGVAHAVRVLGMDKQTSADGLSDVWANNEHLFAHQPFGAGRFTIRSPQHPPGPYGLVDQERFLNLNTATPEILARLFQQAAGLKTLDALTIAEAIADWRDEDREPRPHGAEDFYYLGLSPAYECKDAPFESAEELLLIRGVAPAIYRRVRPLVTAHGSGSVNLNTAEEAVLAALGFSAQGVQGLLWYRAGEDDIGGTEDDRLLESVGAATGELAVAVPAEDLNRLAQLSQQRLVDVKSTAFAVHVSAEAGRRELSADVEAIVDREGKVWAWAQR
ncbi:MAG: general secretion pathway protein GspK [Candidatus Omnitrophica bacterium]|nr:general secretion pathway protein GspK [Candidatus Omnitrophota bacterium]